MSDDVLDELKDQGNRSRKDTEPTATDTDDDTPSLEDAIADAFARIDDGEANEHLTTRDRKLSALFTGLDDADQLVELGQEAADALERDESPETQAEVIRLLLRYSIADLDADLFESGKAGLETYEKAKAKQRAEQASENPF